MGLNLINQQLIESSYLTDSNLVSVKEDDFPSFGPN